MSDRNAETQIKPALGRLLTAGYGNKQPEEFAASLEPVDVALDARLIAWGWHADYRGEGMLNLLRAAGATRARWAPRLGNPAKRDGGAMRIADMTAIDDLVSVLRRGMDVLIVCGCGKVAGCHRRMIAELTRERLPSLEVIDLPRTSKERA